VVPARLLPLILSTDSLVVSTAASERGFSQVNQIMGPTQSSLSVSRLSRSLFVKLNGRPLAQFKPESYVTSWLLTHVTASDDKARSCLPKEDIDSSLQSLWAVL